MKSLDGRPSGDRDKGLDGSPWALKTDSNLVQNRQF